MRRIRQFLAVLVLSAAFMASSALALDAPADKSSDSTVSPSYKNANITVSTSKYYCDSYGSDGCPNVQVCFNPNETYGKDGLTPGECVTVSCNIIVCLQE